MKIFAIIFLLTLFSGLPSNGQTKNSLIQRINEIKSRTDVYYWNQYTHPNADTAKVNATKWLLLYINENRTLEEEVTLEQVLPHVSHIKIDRGNLKQYFVYIKKSDAADIGIKASTVSSIFGETNQTESSPANKTIERAFVPDAFVQRIMETKDFINVYKLLKSLQTQGQIAQFGKLRDVQDYNSLDLILFDIQSQQIITMLSPMTTSGNRTNVVNGSEDSLDNYPTNMTAVIWYIKK